MLGVSPRALQVWQGWFFLAIWFHHSNLSLPECWERRLARGDVRGFLLRRVPPGLDSGTLTIQGRGEEVEIGEFLREADREWLASAGNALLNR